MNIIAHFKNVIGGKSIILHCLKIYLFFIGFCILYLQPVIAQEAESFLVSYNASTLGNKILVTWTTKSGFTCQDIHIELGSDTFNYTRVGTYYGICGDTSEKGYTYIIESPIKNKLNYIRIELGNYGYTHYESTLVIDVSKGVLVLPHPLNIESNLYFNNVAKEPVEAIFYSIKGDIIKQITTNKNYISLEQIARKRGVILYVLKSESFYLRGKLVVQ